jgi:hypothetical protein
MRDLYHEPVMVAAWRSGELGRMNLWLENCLTWIDWVRPAVDRGVDVRRARIVSEPPSEYIRFEYDTTRQVALAAGENVRWLPRSLADSIRLPANDFWLVDDSVYFTHFSGDGLRVGDAEGTPADVEFCAIAFEQVWSLGIDHTDYRLP